MATKKESQKSEETSDNCTDCTDSRLTNCPAFNQDTARKFVEEFNEKTPEEQNNIVTAIRSDIRQFLRDKFTLTLKQGKILDQLQPSFAKEFSCTISLALENNWTLELNIAEDNSGSPVAKKNRKCTIGVSGGYNQSSGWNTTATVSCTFG